MARTTGFSPDPRLANGTGQPSMSVPLTRSEANLPIGAPFTARFGDEATLFRLAGQLERAVARHMVFPAAPDGFA